MCRFFLIFQGFSGFWIAAAPLINTENEGIIRPFSVIECCIYHTRKLFRIIILYFRIDVHSCLAVLMSSQILNCFRINPGIKKIGNVCVSQPMGRRFKIQTVNNLGIVLLMSSQSMTDLEPNDQFPHLNAKLQPYSKKYFFRFSIAAFTDFITAGCLQPSSFAISWYVIFPK